VLTAQRQQVKLDAASGQVVEHLVAGARLSAATRPRQQIDHVVDIEIADAPVTNLALLHQGLERADRLVQRRGIPPMQQVKVEAVGGEPLQAALAGRDGARAAGVRRQHLADDEHLVAAASHRLGDDLFGAAVAIHLRGVDQRYAKLDAEPQRRHLVLAQPYIFAHPPGAEAEHRDRLAGR